ncbi:MAG: hypothetical protein AAB400_05070, partial [Patescibacteria group bacterium]
FGLYKFKGFTREEWGIAACLLILLASIVFLPYPEEYYFAFCMASVTSLYLQPIEMITTKSRGVVDIKLLAIGVVGNIVWLLYANHMQDPVLISVLPLFLLGYTITTFCYVFLPSKKLLEART